MLSNCDYDKIKLLYKFSKLVGFLDKYAVDDAKKECDSCTKLYENIKKDLQKYIDALEVELRK